MSELNFNIELPKGWQDQTMYYFKGPKVDDFDHEIMLNIDRFLQTDDIIEFSRFRIRPIVQSLQGIEVLKDAEITLDGGNPAYEFVFKWAVSDELIEIHKYLFVIRDKLGFTLITRFTKKSYKMLKEQVKEISENILPGTYRAQ